MLSSNEPLKDIVYNRDYQKVSRSVEIPVRVDCIVSKARV
jgi:hypothetical protein